MIISVDFDKSDVSVTLTARTDGVHEHKYDVIIKIGNSDNHLSLKARVCLMYDGSVYIVVSDLLSKILEHNMEMYDKWMEVIRDRIEDTKEYQLLREMIPKPYMGHVSPKTAVEIINETVEYYKNNLRSAVNGQCLYFNKNTGAMCAVGRCLIDPKSVHNTSHVQFIGVENVLREEYRGHSLEFWKDLQNLHDNNCYWIGQNLTYEGRKRVNELLEKYK